jgi:hypothetical protein
MTNEVHHADLVKGIAEHMKTVLEKSSQAIYLYLDDNHKICNKKFADMLGYKSVKEWGEVEAPLADVLEADQPSVVDAYTNASEKMSASVVDVRVKNIKSAAIVKTRMIIVPIGYAGHVFTAHFCTKIWKLTFTWEKFGVLCWENKGGYHMKIQGLWMGVLAVIIGILVLILPDLIRWFVGIGLIVMGVIAIMAGMRK